MSTVKLVRKGGFEPPRYCDRQPLKLVRLPVPPLPRGWARASELPMVPTTRPRRILRTLSICDRSEDDHNERAM